MLDCVFLPLQHLLVNIARAVCCRLDVIDDQLEGICQSTKYLEEQVKELLDVQGAGWKNSSSQFVRKRR